MGEAAVLCAQVDFLMSMSVKRGERERRRRRPSFLASVSSQIWTLFRGLLFVAYSKDTTLERKNPCFFAKLDARDTDDGKSNDPVGFRDAEHKRSPARSFCPISANDSSGLY